MTPQLVTTLTSVDPPLSEIEPVETCNKISGFNTPSSSSITTFTLLDAHVLTPLSTVAADITAVSFPSASTSCSAVNVTAPVVLPERRVIVPVLNVASPLIPVPVRRRVIVVVPFTVAPERVAVIVATPQLSEIDQVFVLNITSATSSSVILIVPVVVVPVAALVIALTVQSIVSVPSTSRSCRAVTVITPVVDPAGTVNVPVLAVKSDPSAVHVNVTVAVTSFTLVPPVNVPRIVATPPDSTIVTVSTLISSITASSSKIVVAELLFPVFAFVTLVMLAVTVSSGSSSVSCTAVTAMYPLTLPAGITIVSVSTAFVPVLKL